MANKKYDDSEGVWRTIGGRRVFIKTGQSLADAMKESGKFSRVEKNKDKYENVSENSTYVDSEIADMDAKHKSKEQVAQSKNLKELEENIIKDKETGNTANRMKAIADQQRYDRLYSRYEEQGYSEKEIKDRLGERPKTGLEDIGKEKDEVKVKDSEKNLQEKYMNIPEKERVKAYEEGKNWKDLVKEYDSKEKSAKDELEEMVNSRKKLEKDIDNYYKTAGVDTGLTEKARQEIISGYDDYDDAISNFAEEHDIPWYRAEEYFEKARKKLGITTAVLKGEKESATSKAINDKIREQARRSQKNQKDLQEKVASSGDDVAEEMRYADDKATFRKISKTYGYDNLSDNEIKEALDFAENRGLYHSKEEIATMRRYLDSRVLRNEFDTYKKEHPESKMSFTEWKRNNKK